jgi:mRNA-degrading endonuclease RelE of RelBE toxin-antitoxin system
MSYAVRQTPLFMKQSRRLDKRYFSWPDDLSELLIELRANPMAGSPLGRNCYKVRVAIASKNKGKSGGARVVRQKRARKPRPR